MAEKRLHETESSEYDSNIDSERFVSDQDPDDNVENTSCSHKVSGKERSDNRQDKKTSKKKYKTRYCKEWVNKFPFVKPCSQYVKDKEYKFFCSACNVNLSCSQGDINDVSTHSTLNYSSSIDSSRGADFKIELVNDMKNSPFSIMIDGRLGVDNTNVNIGEHDSIKSRVLAKEPKVVVIFDIEDHCVDLYYWFDKSTKRKEALKEYFEFCDTEYEAVVKYISVRWLCLERCLDRELKKYVALKSYFCSENEHDNRFQRLNAAFNDSMSELFLLFFQSVIAMFTNFNRFLQREDPLLYLMNEQMEVFMSKLASKFVKPEKVIAHKQNEGSMKSLDISIANQKEDSSLSVGMVTKGKMRSLLDEGDINLRSIDKFYDGIREFYSTAFAYCTKWLPLNNTLLKNCVFVDFKKRNQCSMDNVEEVLSALEHIHSDLIHDPRAMDILEEEFLVYQAMAETDIPEHIWKESVVTEKTNVDGGETLTYHRMDMIWGYLRDKLPNLSKVTLSVLTIPHSNAAEERVFSMIRKNKTDFRSNLDLETSLSAIMTIKMNKPASLMPCHKFKPSTELLKKCKSACTEYNRAHSSHGNVENS
ncbi:ATP-dependent DNA helicase [Paramuricea clavata]|uniref:ATP-dependent DNA helicase n=1 Tax=Paramuricea clavata TaxID=317549 RepID=A0A7D9EPE3_PARCT|nr:ATP-dependent DNA helicase [Paramuricea clavata]